jgi:hypothetical protein
MTIILKMTNLSKMHQFLGYIIKHHPDSSITGLMKLSYIIDLVSIKKSNQQISAFEYIRYNYGPFSRTIYEYLNSLIEHKVIREDSQIANTGDEFVVYNFNKKRTEPSFDKLTKSERSVIDEVLESLQGYGARALTELAYRTKPMQKIGATLQNKKGLNQRLDLHAS